MCLCEAVASVVIVGAERSRVATSRLSLASCSLLRLGEEEEEGERKLDEERRKEEEQMKRGRTKTVHVNCKPTIALHLHVVQAFKL